MRRKAPDCDRDEDAGPQKSRKVTRDEDVGLATEGNTRPVRSNRGQGGAAAQLEAVTEKFSKKQQGTSKVNTIPQDAPINPMAPVKHVKGGGKLAPAKDDLPLSMNAPAPVLINAGQGSRYGFKTGSQRSNAPEEDDEIVPDSEHEDSTMQDPEDSKFRGTTMVFPDNDNDINIDEQSPDEDESQARKYLRAPRQQVHNRVILSDEDDTNSYSVVERYRKKNGNIRPPNPMLLNSKQQDYQESQPATRVDLREHLEGRAQPRYQEKRYGKPTTHTLQRERIESRTHANKMPPTRQGDATPAAPAKRHTPTQGHEPGTHSRMRTEPMEPMTHVNEQEYSQSGTHAIGRGSYVNKTPPIRQGDTTPAQHHTPTQGHKPGTHSRLRTEPMEPRTHDNEREYSQSGTHAMERGSRPGNKSNQYPHSTPPHSNTWGSDENDNDANDDYSQKYHEHERSSDPGDEDEGNEDKGEGYEYEGDGNVYEGEGNEYETEGNEYEGEGNEDEGEGNEDEGEGRSDVSDTLDDNNKRRRTRNSQSRDATPTQLRFYSGSWVDVLRDAKLKYRFIIHTETPFPERNSDTLKSAHDCLNDAIAKYQETQDFELDMSEEFSAPIQKVFEDGASYRGRMKTLARNLVPTYYKKYLEPKIKGGHNSADLQQTIAYNVNQLLDESLFHMVINKDGSTDNFSHPAVITLCHKFYYADKDDSLATLFPAAFRALPPACLAMACACIVNCLDEYKMGYYKKCNFTGHDYAPTHKAMLKLMSTLEKRSPAHKKSFQRLLRTIGKDGSNMITSRPSPKSTRVFKVRF